METKIFNQFLFNLTLTLKNTRIILCLLATLPAGLSRPRYRLHQIYSFWGWILLVFHSSSWRYGRRKGDTFGCAGSVPSLL